MPDEPAKEPEVTVEPVVDAELVVDPEPAAAPVAPVDTGYTAGGVPTFESVREKIETRYGTAIGAAELAAETPEGRTVEEQYEARQRAAAERLAQIRESMRTAKRVSVVGFGGQDLGEESVGRGRGQPRPREIPDAIARLRRLRRRRAPTVTVVVRQSWSQAADSDHRLAARASTTGTPPARRRPGLPHRRRARSATERRYRWVSPGPTTPLAQSLSPSCRRPRCASRRCSRPRRTFREERRTSGASRRPSRQSPRWLVRDPRPRPAR